MERSPILILFDNEETCTAFYGSNAPNIFSSIAPISMCCASAAASYVDTLKQYVNAPYCRTIVAIGKGFCAPDLLSKIKNCMLAYEEKAVDGRTFIRLNHDTHLCLCRDLQSLDQISDVLADYYRIIDGRHMLALSREIGALLKARGWTISSAESCSGGLIVKTLTDISGASAYVAGGACTYTADAKIQVLDVPSTVISTYGIVSRETALAMAEGAQSLYHSTIALSTTGVAGPGADDDGNPEGLVYVGLAINETFTAYKYTAETYSVLMDRDLIRKGCVIFALEKLRESLQ